MFQHLLYQSDHQKVAYICYSNIKIGLIYLTLIKLENLVYKNNMKLNGWLATSMKLYPNTSNHGILIWFPNIARSKNRMCEYNFNSNLFY